MGFDRSDLTVEPLDWRLGVHRLHHGPMHTLMAFHVLLRCYADKPAARANGPVRPSAMPMTTSRTICVPVKCFSVWGASVKNLISVLICWNNGWNARNFCLHVAGELLALRGKSLRVAELNKTGIARMDAGQALGVLDRAPVLLDP